MATASVASCASCGSLASRCPEKACQSWNRSFVRFCRRCGQDLRGSSGVWDELRTANPAGGPTAIGPPEVVADLSDLDGPPNSRSHRVAISAVQGFLAVHQAGGFVALVRPFSATEGGLAYSFREPETSPAALPAYAPSILPGGRLLLLADRRGVSVIDLWDTDISAAARTGRGPNRFTPPGPIAWEPIALGESKVGLVLGTPNSYSWLVWEPGKSAPAMKPFKDKITGGLCEAALVAGKTLAFATPDGHWAWRIEDAEARRVDEIRETWKAGAEGVDASVEIDSRADKPENFAIPSQVFLSSTPGGPFYWHFRTTDGRARSYRLAADLSTDDRFEFEGTSPVGVAVRPGQKRPSMIFEQNNRLFEERDIKGRLSPCQVSLPGEGRAGLQLVGTLIVTIGNRRGGSRSRPIEVQSLWEGRAPIRTEDIPGLSSDPFVWSGHMFTVERPGDDKLTLVRRALIAPSEVPA
jgi:hypothetical protein